ncbi:MAG: polyhydroxyalkanoic acid system family protein [Planctomycetia bacterium]|nr:polyhydroxyalkanoic acid system family protein [Planctomycetia bacterium]
MPHTLGQQKAVEHLHGLMGKMKQQYSEHIQDFEESWQGNVLSYSFRTFGMSIRGTMEVRETEVEVEASIPLAALMVKGKIEQEIRGALTKALS